MSEKELERHLRGRDVVEQDRKMERWTHDRMEDGKVERCTLEQNDDDGKGVGE